MKYALIGCGRIATNHIKAVLNNHLEFAAACDVECRSSMETLLAKHGLEHDSIHRIATPITREMIEEVNSQTLVGIATESGASCRDRSVLH